MTKYSVTRVNCPACCEDADFKICTSIDAGKNPELKEKIFSRELFLFTCPECGEKITVAYDCTLYDRKNGYIVALITDGSSDEARTRLEVEGCSLRITHSINEFVEKIALFEDKIDDKVTELYKLMLEGQYEDERPGAEILGIYYGGRDFENNSLLFFIITADRENCRASLSMDTYKAIEEQFAASAGRYSHDCEINSDWAVAVLQSGAFDKKD